MLAAGQPSGAATVTLGSLYFWAVVALWLAAVVRARPLREAEEASSLA
jgi:hypothetical protein